CSSDQVPARGEAQTTPRAFCCEFQSAVVMSSPRRTSSQLHLTEPAPRPRERQCWSESSCGGRVFALTCGTLRLRGVAPRAPSALAAGGGAPQCRDLFGRES